MVTVMDVPPRPKEGGPKKKWDNEWPDEIFLEGAPAKKCRKANNIRLDALLRQRLQQRHKESKPEVGDKVEENL